MRTESSITAGAKDRVALVTGGGRGIGRAIVLELARHGVSVAIGYRSDAEAANSVAEEVLRRGVRSTAIEADVAEIGASALFVRQTTLELGRLDILVSVVLDGADGELAIDWAATAGARQRAS